MNDVTSHHMRGYRADIDGLRAAAVAAVVLFHAKIPGLGGGFVGVDVFFVISGFLITGVLLRSIEDKDRSVWRFYEARIRRILPALFAVTLCTLLVSVFILVPAELKRTSAAVAGTAVFASNFVFWLQSGYFSAASLSRPLLHTWSLGVEEQFYIVYPLALRVIIRIAPSRAYLITIFLTIVALAVSEFLVRYAPGVAFFLAPGRAWELLLGCALSHSAVAAPQSRIFREAIATAGWAALIASAVGYTPLTPFPGVASVLPCVGTALIIWANTGAHTFSGRVLSSRFAVGIGLISYSLYLWHWPLLVFVRVWLHRPLHLYESAFIVAASIVLAAISWRYIEQPFRTRRILLRSNVFAVAGAVSAALFVAGSIGYIERGWPQRFPPNVNKMLAFMEYDGTKEFATTYGVGHCFGFSDKLAYDPHCFRVSPTQRNIVLWGDSHAAHYASAIGRRLSLENVHLIQATRAGCPPVLDVEFARSVAYCGVFNNQIVELVSGTKIDGAILSGFWLVNELYGMSIDEEIDGVERTIAFLRKRKIPVVVMGPSIAYAENLPILLVSKRDRDGKFPETLSTDFFEGLFVTDQKMKDRFAHQPGVTYVSVLDRVCPHRRCPTMTAGQVPLQWDLAHLTAPGARYVVNRLLDQDVLGRLRAPKEPVEERPR